MRLNLARIGLERLDRIPAPLLESSPGTTFVPSGADALGRYLQAQAAFDRLRTRWINRSGRATSGRPAIGG